MKKISLDYSKLDKFVSLGRALEAMQSNFS